MARINLLPWRETARKQREIEFYVKLGLAVAGSVLFLLYLHLRIDVQLETQGRRNQYLTTQIGAVDQDIGTIKNLEKDKEQLLARMGIIEQLQTSRAAIVHLLETLAQYLPDGARFVKVSLQDDGLELTGVADGHGRVSAFMRNLEKSGWVHATEIGEINENSQEYAGMYLFTLRARYAQKPKIPNNERADL